ncbi:MAG: DUF456 domain-containing protein [candidate division Zixibacteria bacterium]|nr:DUF456 domain-containing protein [candidate division Zixibacteria bacterium]
MIMLPLLQTSTGEILLFAGCLLTMLIGVAGVIVPVIPGLPLIWTAMAIFGYFTGYAYLSGEFLVYSGIAVAVIWILQHFVQVYGAKKWGASRWGMLGAFVGMVIGLFVGSLVGVIIGPLVGAVIAELLVGKSVAASLKAGAGTFVGFAFGAVVQLIVSFVLIGIFLYRVFVA